MVCVEQSSVQLVWSRFVLSFIHKSHRQRAQGCTVLCWSHEIWSAAIRVRVRVSPPHTDSRVLLFTQRRLAEVWKMLCQQADLSLLMPYNHLTLINLFHPMMHLFQTGHIHSPAFTPSDNGVVSLQTCYHPLSTSALSYSPQPCSWRRSLKYWEARSD